MLKLMSLLPQRPGEFYDRVSAMVDVHLEPYLRKTPRYETVEWETAVEALDEPLGACLAEYLQEDSLREIEDQVREGIGAMPEDAPFASFHNGDFTLGRLCYALTRIKRPNVIIETGVCYGVTSSFMLKALQINGRGSLYSIDLPPLGENADAFVGRLIPADLRRNWKLNRGSSRKLLSGILESIGAVDMFVHDSLHTYRNMRFEFELVAPHLSSDAIVVADDIEGNSAFDEWSRSAHPVYSSVLREHAKRKSLLGIAVCGKSHAERPEAVVQGGYQAARNGNTR
ncbi:MAG: class I SAM-dependent methyltransferase [Candidatus Sulfotelmatobacter sp.]